jgi:hypothetical protein
VIAARWRAFALCVCAATVAQEPATDWSIEVERACTNARYGLRLAAARKVAEAGDAAVPAVQAFEKQRGKDAVPVSLVEAFAQRGGNGTLTLGLLQGWAADRDCFWRGQAMLGLAQRARENADIAKACADLFQKHLTDPAWLTRTHARFGARKTDLPEPDPRAKSRLAGLLLAQGDASKVADLVEALADERTFLGDPWGKRRALEAFNALKAWLGDDCGYQPAASWAENRERAARLCAAIAAKAPAAITAPASALTDSVGPPAGGIEILSCKLGDLFLCWSSDGTLSAGLTGEQHVNLPREKFLAWAGGHWEIRNDGQQGVVICDKLRLKWDQAGLGSKSDQSGVALHFVAAPHALPQATVDWLRSLALLIEEGGSAALAGALRERLQQFAPGAAR